MNVLRIVVAVAVTLVWAVVYLAPYFKSNAPSAPPEVSGVMLLIVGYLVSSAGRDVISKTTDRARRVRDALKDPVDDNP